MLSGISAAVPEPVESRVVILNALTYFPWEACIFSASLFFLPFLLSHTIGWIAERDIFVAGIHKYRREMFILYTSWLLLPKRYKTGHYGMLSLLTSPWKSFIRCQQWASGVGMSFLTLQRLQWVGNYEITAWDRLLFCSCTCLFSFFPKESRCCFS